MRELRPVELEETEEGAVGKGWLLFAVVAMVLITIVVMLITGIAPVPDVVALVATSTTLPSATPGASTDVPPPLATPSVTSSPTPTALPPTPTLVPPTPTSTPTATPTSTSTPLPAPTPLPQGPPTRPPIVTRQQWGSMEITEGYRPHTVDRITLHHDGAEFRGGAKARLRALQSWSRRRGWVDIPYHFLIDLEGNIYEARPLGFAGDTATHYDPTGHALITVMGNYNVQEINEAQLGAVVDLASWLCYEYSISPHLIRGHRDYAATSCPGANLYLYLANGHIVTAVERRLQFDTQ